MERGYNRGRTVEKFHEGDLVLMDVHGLKLIREKEGVGRKLLPKYDGPFEIMEVISPVAYRLRLPATYRIHPVINRAFLEAYHPPPAEFSNNRPKKPFQREHFDAQPEFEIERIIDERMSRGQRGMRIRKYRVRWVGYDETYDEWLTRAQLRNAPGTLRDWEGRDKTTT